MSTRKLAFPVFDADNHMYETPEALTKFLPPEYKGVIQYVQVNGRTKVAIKGQISNYIPNPTFNKVAPPGAMEIEFKLKNPSSNASAQDLKLEPPPRYIEAPPAFFEPAPRLALMDELGLDRSMMWPTLASLVEERLAGDLPATHAVVHALNQWMYETWSFNYEDRIFATPVITLPIVDKAIEELEWVLDRGARAILVRPAPVPDVDGRRRSFALEEFDPFWKLVEEADIVVGMHASDDGSQRYLNEWEGLRGDEFQPFAGRRSAFVDIITADHRGIHDVVASIVGHGLASRFPRLKIVPVENGSAWVRPLVQVLERLYERTPHIFSEDPVAALKRCVYVHPFHEEDPLGLIELVGVDNVVFGSDYPHPEGMYDPTSFVDELASLTEGDKAKVMGGNMDRLMKIGALGSPRMFNL
ncbi:MAG TPA: amidohydrolase family protein [Acidimicrobiales bacterium]|nr:amidohydrolase family protein [Acidimicrobiales bacterium]